MSKFMIAKIEQEINRIMTLVEYSNLTEGQALHILFGLTWAKNGLDEHKVLSLFKQEDPSSKRPPKPRLVK